MNGYLAAIIILTLCSTFFSATETAFSSANKIKLKNLAADDNKRAEHALALAEDFDRLITAVLVGNTISNITMTTVATVYGIMTWGAKIGPTLATIMVTLLVLIVGEITPKILAAKKPVKFARFMARTLQALIVVFKPLSKLLVNSTSFMDKHLEKKKAEISMDDLSTAVDIATEASTPIEEKNMLKGIATFTEKEVSSVMKPRIDIIAVEQGMDFRNMLETVIQSGFSRIPVYEESLDKVSGILYVKDLLPYLDAQTFAWQTLVRPAFFVPENRKINDLFQDFREKKIHIAIVVDEYGGTSGLITMEDVIEEIVGDINDEFDNVKQEEHFTKLDDGTYLFKAQTSIVDFCKVFNLDEDYFEEQQGEADTLAGLVLEIEGRIPEVGFSFDVKGFNFEITEADTRRIIQIKVKTEN